MTFLLKFADDLWNVRWVKGHRTTIGKVLLALIGGYQLLSTAPQVTPLVDLPDLPQLWVSGVLGYLALKLDQFARDHATPPAPGP